MWNFLRTWLWPSSASRKWSLSASVCGLLILSGSLLTCQSPYPWRETVVTVRQMDRNLINEVCRGLGLQESANGCYDKGIVYCPDDARGTMTCLHEMRPARFGGFHK